MSCLSNVPFTFICALIKHQSTAKLTKDGNLQWVNFPPVLKLCLFIMVIPWLIYIVSLCKPTHKDTVGFKLPCMFTLTHTTQLNFPLRTAKTCSFHAHAVWLD